MDASLINVEQWTDPLKTRGWVQSGGNLSLSATPDAINTARPRSFAPLLAWEAREPIACEWQLALQHGSRSTVPAPAEGWSAGAIDPISGAVWSASGLTNARAMCKVELGQGPDARVIYTDLRPGRFNLGVQSRVRISVSRWFGAEPDGLGIDVQSAVAPASGSPADPPIYSATANVLSGAEKFIVQPPGAQWLDLFFAMDIDDPGTLAIAMPDARVEINSPFARYYKNSDPAAPVCWPYSTPWPVVHYPGDVMRVQNFGSAVNVTVMWWVR